MSGIKEADALLAFADEVVRTARAAGAEQAECYVREGRTATLSCKGDIAYPSESHNVGFSVRVAMGKRLGLAGSSGLHRVHDVIEEALATARSASPHKHFESFAPPAKTPLAPSPVHDAIFDPDPARLQEIVDTAMAGLTGPDVTYRSFSLVTGRNRWALANSEGHSAWDQGGRESISLEARVTRGTRDVTTWDSWTGLAPITTNLDIDAFCRAATGRATRAIDAKPLDRPVESVILDTAPASQVVSKFIAGLCGPVASSGQSPLSDRLGEEVASAQLTLHDAPHGGGHAQRLRYDHEGIPTQAVPLVEHGILRNYLYDTLSGKAAGAASNGHGMRPSGWAGGIGVSVIHPVMSSGTRDLDGLIADADRAVFVPDALTGMFTANPTTGDFSATMPYAFYVERGEIRHAIPNATLGGNVLTMLNNVHGLGKDLVERRAGTFPAVFAGGVSCAT